MVKSIKILSGFLSRLAVWVFTASIFVIISGVFCITRRDELRYLWDVFPELIGVFAALIYGYYWQDTAEDLARNETWKRIYLNILIELETNKEKLERVSKGYKALLKTTSWEIHREGFLGGSSGVATIASEIYYIMISLNMHFTNEFVNKAAIIYDAEGYSRVCLKLITDYRNVLEKKEWYGKEEVQKYIDRYSGHM